MKTLFRHILCPIDFSEHSSLALRYAAAFANGSGGKLNLFHAIPDLRQEINYIDQSYFRTVQEDLLIAAKERMNLLDTTCCGKIELEKKIGQGSPADAILQESQESAADLIVMGTHGWGGYDRFLLGSVTNKVLHKSVVPVLVVSHPTHQFVGELDQSVRIHRILCAMELEPSDAKVMDLAVSLARTFGSEITFLHVARESDGQDWFEQEAISTRTMKRLVTMETDDSLKKEFIVDSGRPAERILYAVERYGIDLLVMGHHGRLLKDEPALGSVAKRVVSDSACPVLVYRSHVSEPAIDSDAVRFGNEARILL
jgi:nucleotide-binding universal stress UspA family protein